MVEGAIGDGRMGAPPADVTHALPLAFRAHHTVCRRHVLAARAAVCWETRRAALLPCGCLLPHRLLFARRACAAIVARALCACCACALSSATKQLLLLRKSSWGPGNLNPICRVLSGGLLCPMLKTSAARRRLRGRRTLALPAHAGARLRCAEDGTGHGGTEGFTHCVAVAGAEAWRGACTCVPEGRADVGRVRLRRKICALPL